MLLSCAHSVRYCGTSPRARIAMQRPITRMRTSRLSGGVAPERRAAMRPACAARVPVSQQHGRVLRARRDIRVRTASVGTDEYIINPNHPLGEPAHPKGAPACCASARGVLRKGY
jgi:hypothetical protein